MNYFNHKNVQLAYEAVYNQDLCESMEDLGLIDDYDYLDEGHADTIRALRAEMERESQNKENLHGDIESNILKLLKLRERPIPIRSNTSSTQIRHRVKKPARRSTEEAYELYNSLLEYLLDEGYADTLGSAEIILENMSEDWIYDILEGFVDPEEGENPSGRRPIDVVSEHPKKSVRRKAVAAMAKQMGKEYGGRWRAKHPDPVDG